MNGHEYRISCSQFLGMVTYANEFKTKEKEKISEIKKLTATYTFAES